MKAIITIEVRREYYEMEYAQVYKLEYEGKTKDEILSQLYHNRLRYDGKVKVEFIEE